MSTTMTAIATSSIKIPPSTNNILSSHTPVENNDTTGSGSPIIRSTSKLGMFSVVSSRNSPVLQRATSMDYLASPSHSADGILNNSLPNLDNNSMPYNNNSPNSSPKPLRSAMSSRTLHESLHRGLSSSNDDQFSKSENNLLQKRNVSFTQVKIREYERVRGVNSDVYGPPLSIGWRYNTPTELDVSEYEEAKGAPRSSAEYLVPKKVREKILKEHTDDGKKGDGKAKEMLGYWDQPGHIPRNQRRHSISFGNNNPNAQQQSIDKKKKSKGMKHKLKKIIKENNPLTKIPPYKQQEDQLWNNAHQIAIEKAKRLEESIINGEKQTLDVRDLYSVGTPLNNVMPSRRNSVPVVTLLPSLLLDEDNDGVGVEKRRCSAPAVVVQQRQQLQSAPQSRISSAAVENEEEQVGLSLSISGHTETESTKSSGEGKNAKKIVATEEDDDGEGSNDTDDDVRLAQLLYEDAVINDKNDDSTHPPAA